MENDPVVALDLEGIVIGMAEGQAQVALAASVRLAGPSFDAALPDVDALDGRTFGLAAALRERRVSIAGSRPEDLPPTLRAVPFLPKPRDPARIEQTLRAKPAPPR